MIESSVTTPITVNAEDGSGSGGKSSSLRYTYKDGKIHYCFVLIINDSFKFFFCVFNKLDQWSPANPEGKKTYDRTFLLELMNNPASQKKPDGLPNLEVVRDKVIYLLTALKIF